MLQSTFNWVPGYDQQVVVVTLAGELSCQEARVAAADLLTFSQEALSHGSVFVILDMHQLSQPYFIQEQETKRVILETFDNFHSVLIIPWHGKNQLQKLFRFMVSRLATAIDTEYMFVESIDESLAYIDQELVSMSYQTRPSLDVQLSVE